MKNITTDSSLLDNRTQQDNQLSLGKRQGNEGEANVGKRYFLLICYNGKQVVLNIFKC